MNPEDLPYSHHARLFRPDELSKTIAILGSAPSAPQLTSFATESTIILALNNAHRAVARTDIALYAGDLPPELRHPAAARIGRSTPDYLPAMQACGGFVFCGATIAFAAAYWTMCHYPHSQVLFFACNMVYDSPQSHFYGQGKPDPLRRNLTLQSLEAKSLRVFYFGLLHEVLFLNASPEPASRLQIPRVPAEQAFRCNWMHRWRTHIIALRDELDVLASAALALERAGVIDGNREDYFNYTEEAAWDYVRQIDQAWLALRPAVQRFQTLLQRTDQLTD